jgi:hypothetical protein
VGLPISFWQHAAGPACCDCKKEVTTLCPVVSKTKNVEKQTFYRVADVAALFFFFGFGLISKITIVNIFWFWTHFKNRNCQHKFNGISWILQEPEMRTFYIHNCNQVDSIKM